MKTNLHYIRIDELETYGQSEAYKQLTTVPITPLRIVSHLQNPRAEPHDIALIVAEDEEKKVIGFIGLLPDFIFNHAKEKVFWISCWWVDELRGKNLGVPLLFAAYKASQGKLLADSIPSTLPVFAKSKMFSIPDTVTGLRLFLQPCLAKIIERKKPEWRKFEQFIKVSDQLAKILFTPFFLLGRLTTSLPTRLVIQKLEAIEEETDNFIYKHNRKEAFRRGKEELNWIILHPWLLETEKKNDLPFYPFSAQTKLFKSYPLSVSKNGHLIAFLFFTNREKAFKLHYAYFSEEHLQEVSEFIAYFLYKQKAEEFTTFEPRLSSTLRSLFPLAFKHPVTYQYVWGKEIKTLSDASSLQYGDGDAIFT